MDRIRRQVIIHALDLPCPFESFRDVIALAVYGGIDLVGYLPIALILLEAYIVRACANPNQLSVPREGSFPEAEVMAAGDYRVGLSVLVAQILGSVE